VKVGEVQCSIYIIKEGVIEDYADGIQHNKNGAFTLLNNIKTYTGENKTDDPKIEELKEIVEKIIAL
jgi:3-phosphoglycerate kinase